MKKHFLSSIAGDNFWGKFCVKKSNKPLTFFFFIVLFSLSRKNSSISKFLIIIMTCSKKESSFFEVHVLLFCLCIFSLSFEKAVWVAFIESCGLLNTLHYFTQIKKKFHDNFSSVLRIFSYESAKLRALRAHVPTCLTCLRANVSCVLRCSCDITKKGFQ